MQMTEKIPLAVVGEKLSKTLRYSREDITLQWRVSSVEPNDRLQGLLVHLDGAASIGHGKPALIARGTSLVKELAA